MPELPFALLATVAVVAGVRGAWSPCGLSMLSTITPLAERARGHRFVATAAWFAVGAVVGGAALGVVVAALAWAVASSGLSAQLLLAVMAGGALYAACSDLRIPGFRVPLLARQVDELWVSRYRPWVYGAGFGAQVGVGVATYVMTAGVFLLIGGAALTANPTAALALCVLFGLTRGLCIFVGAGIDSPEALRVVHRRLERMGPASLLVCATVELFVVAGLLGASLGSRGILAGSVIAATVVVGAVVHARVSSARGQLSA